MHYTFNSGRHKINMQLYMDVIFVVFCILAECISAVLGTRTPESLRPTVFKADSSTNRTHCKLLRLSGVPDRTAVIRYSPTQKPIRDETTSDMDRHCLRPNNRWCLITPQMSSSDSSALFYPR